MLFPFFYMDAYIDVIQAVPDAEAAAKAPDPVWIWEER